MAMPLSTMIHKRQARLEPPNWLYASITAYHVAMKNTHDPRRTDRRVAAWLPLAIVICAVAVATSHLFAAAANRKAETALFKSMVIRER